MEVFDLADIRKANESFEGAVDTEARSGRHQHSERCRGRRQCCRDRFWKVVPGDKAPLAADPAPARQVLCHRRDAAPHGALAGPRVVVRDRLPNRAVIQRRPTGRLPACRGRPTNGRGKSSDDGREPAPSSPIRKPPRIRLRHRTCGDHFRPLRERCDGLRCGRSRSSSTMTSSAITSFRFPVRFVPAALGCRCPCTAQWGLVVGIRDARRAADDGQRCETRSCPRAEGVGVERDGIGRAPTPESHRVRSDTSGVRRGRDLRDWPTRSGSVGTRLGFRGHHDLVGDVSRPRWVTSSRSPDEAWEAQCSIPWSPGVRGMRDRVRVGGFDPGWAATAAASCRSNSASRQNWCGEREACGPCAARHRDGRLRALLAVEVPVVS